MEKNGRKMASTYAKGQIAGARQEMNFDEQKALELSQKITELYDRFDANPAEVCSATVLALRVYLDCIPDAKDRALCIVNVIKHLTSDPKKINLIVPANGN